MKRFVRKDPLTFVNNIKEDLVTLSKKPPAPHSFSRNTAAAPAFRANEHVLGLSKDAEAQLKASSKWTNF
jgi:hypothetical protein